MAMMHPSHPVAAAAVAVASALAGLLLLIGDRRVR